MKPSGRVLIAGFDPETREAYAQALTTAGLRTTTTEDGISALMKAVALRPRAVVLDAALPGITGPEVARRLQGFPTRDIPVFLVGDVALKDPEAAAQFACFRKGCSPAVLVTAVLAHLRR
jgi:CheY-like chemotaxis protein